MLAGLIFATDDAHDRPDLLAATLPFGGATLIEFQARLMLTAGAGQLIIVVTRLTPELLGAVNRLGRRGIAVDIVRTAGEAIEKLHPLARVLVMADGLVTTDRIVGLLAGEGPDCLLVTSDADALPGLERVGADAIWAGMARVEARRIADVAAMPKEYDFESTLLRVTAQSGAEHLLLPTGPIRAGHGIERDSARLSALSAEVMTSLISGRAAWIDRHVIDPVARMILPLLARRTVPAVAVGGAAATVMLMGLALIAGGWFAAGMLLVVAATMGLATGSVLSWMRDEADLAAFLGGTIIGGAGLAALLLGLAITRAEGTGTGLVTALSLLAMAAMAERGSSARIRKRWWGSPAAYPVILVPFVLVGQPLIGLFVSAGYAAVSLAAVIEALRKKP